jgi:hypothetical protein
MKGPTMLTWLFWRQAIERAAKTAAQFMLVFIGGSAVADGAPAAFNILEVDLLTAAGYALAGAVVSFLTSMASSPFTESGTPSLVEQ